MCIGIAYSSSIGGITTLPGTSANLIFSEYLNQWVSHIRCMLMRHIGSGGINVAFSVRLIQSAAQLEWNNDWKTPLKIMFLNPLSLHSAFTQTATASTLPTGSCCACPSVLSCCCWHGSGCTGSSLAQSECQHTICRANHLLSVLFYSDYSLCTLHLLFCFISFIILFWFLCINQLVEASSHVLYMCFIIVKIYYSSKLWWWISCWHL